MGSEGGSITLFKTIDSQKRESYSYAINEMDYDLEDLTPVDFSSESIPNFEEANRILKNKYPNLLMLYPVFIDTSIVDFISKEKKYLIKNKFLAPIEMYWHVLQQWF